MALKTAARMLILNLFLAATFPALRAQVPQSDPKPLPIEGHAGLFGSPNGASLNLEASFLSHTNPLEFFFKNGNVPDTEIRVGLGHWQRAKDQTSVSNTYGIAALRAPLRFVSNEYIPFIEAGLTVNKLKESTPLDFRRKAQSTIFRYGVRLSAGCHITRFEPIIVGAELGANILKRSSGVISNFQLIYIIPPAALSSLSHIASKVGFK